MKLLSAVGLFSAAFILVLSLFVGVHPADAAFSGINGRIVYAKQDAQLTYDLYTVKPDGTGAVDLGQTGNDPVFSPSGLKIAFLDDNKVKVMNRDGSGVTTILTPGVDDAVIDMTWSPDGTKLALEYVVDFSLPGQDSNIVTINSDGSGLADVTGAATSQYAEKDPHWNPSGTALVYYRILNDGSDSSEIYTVPATGGTATQLAAETDIDLRHPQFSPDGASIVYVRIATKDVSDVPTDSDIYTMSSNGGSQAVVINSSAVDWDPSYSPDGTKIVFHRGVAGGFSTQSLGELYTMAIDGSNLTSLSISNVEEPDWGRALDSTYAPSCTTQAGSTCTSFTPTVPVVCSVAGLSPTTGAFGATITEGGFGYQPIDSSVGNQQFTYVYVDTTYLDRTTCNFTVTFVPKTPDTGSVQGGGFNPLYALGFIGLASTGLLLRRRVRR